MTHVYSAQYSSNTFLTDYKIGRGSQFDYYVCYAITSQKKYYLDVSFYLIGCFRGIYIL